MNVAFSSFSPTNVSLIVPLQTQTYDVFHTSKDHFVTAAERELFTATAPQYFRKLCPNICIGLLYYVRGFRLATIPSRIPLKQS